MKGASKAGLQDYKRSQRGHRGGVGVGGAGGGAPSLTQEANQMELFGIKG
jgi:hypothetical protein